MKMFQTATYWAKGVINGFGQMDYPKPIRISVRWEDKQKLFIDDTGEQALSSAIVYADSNIDLSEGGYLFLGESTEVNPINEPKAYKIKSVSIIPNLRNTRREVKAWL